MARPSARCERCRMRRIKCDKKWPTCTSCSRSNATCSGPPKEKFVYVKGSGDQQPQSLPTAISISTTNRRSSKARTTAAGSTFATFCLAANSPATSVSLTTSDLVAGIAINVLETSSFNNKQFLLSNGWLALLPSRVSLSSALRDCVNLFFSTWTNYQRGLPCDQVTDPKAFGRAIRSMQKALDRGDRSAELLAAVTLLEKHEIMFDSQRQNQRTSHRKGMAALTKIKGPPDRKDELDMRLRADNFIITMLEMHKGGEATPEALHRETNQLLSVIANVPSMSSSERHVYELAAFFEHIMHIFNSFTHICSLPASESRTALAETLIQRTSALIDRITNHCTPIINGLLASGTLTVTADETPVGERYHLTDAHAGAYLILSTQNRIGLTRVIQALCRLTSGVVPADLEQRDDELCKRIWMQLPSIREEGRMSAIMWSEQFLVAYKRAKGPVKQYLIDWIKEVGEYRGRIKGSAEEVDQTLQRLGALLAGEAT